MKEKLLNEVGGGVGGGDMSAFSSPRLRNVRKGYTSSSEFVYTQYKNKKRNNVCAFINVRNDLITKRL